jgi:hypothetical protein
MTNVVRLVMKHFRNNETLWYECDDESDDDIIKDYSDDEYDDA